MNKTIKVILADDHRVFREGLRLLIRSQEGMEVTAEAEDGRTAVQLAAELSPDVVVMDINMPDLDGVEATRRITAGEAGMAAGTRPKVVALSAFSDRRFAMDMLKAGASGYVVKASAFAELAGAVKAVMANRTYFSRAVTDAMVKDFANGNPGAGSSQLDRLSPREQEILHLMADGYAMKQVASRLGVSVKTVETHRRNLMEKLGIDNIAGLTKFALREAVTSLDGQTHPSAGPI